MSFIDRPVDSVITYLFVLQDRYRSNPQEVFLRKGFRKICSKFTGEHPCRRVILIKLASNFIEITPWHACSPVNLLHIFRASFPRNTSGGMLLQIFDSSDEKDLGQTSCLPNFKDLLLEQLYVEKRNQILTQISFIKL